MKRLILMMLLSQEALSADPQRSNAWSRIPQSYGTVSEAIGGYANGCQTGAVKVPPEGTGFIDIRRWRKRFYTQPSTLRLIQHVGQALAPRRILVGDSSQAIGGRMPFGHSSHQNGLDVDFWFYTVGEREQVAAKIEPPSLVNMMTGTVQTWHQDYRQALYAAAQFPETERIFVNPVIKQYLCETELERDWLAKIRPWQGHDAHFHVRLRCPADSPDCTPQKPLDGSHGCNADLWDWVQRQTWSFLNPQPPKPSKPKALPALHPRCEALLHEAQLSL